MYKWVFFIKYVFFKLVLWKKLFFSLVLENNFYKSVDLRGSYCDFVFFFMKIE